MMNLKKLHNNWREVILLSACFVLALSVLSGCKKTSSKFGTEVLDINDLLASGGVDTFQLKTYSVVEDSLTTDNQIFGIVGAYHDPKFGIVNTSLYTQFTIEGQVQLTGFTLNNIDSVVLSLNYGGYYGKLDPQTFEVYELADSLGLTTDYYRNSTKPTTGPNLVDPGSATQTPKTSDKVVIDSDGDGDNDTLNPQLRLKLDNSLGQQFINDIIAGNAAFQSSDQFLSSDYFKGLKINVTNTSPASGQGAVLYFNLQNSQTKMTIYFKVVGDTNQRQISLKNTAKCADFNHADIDHSGYHVASVLANPLNGQTQFYTQSLDSRAVVEFPSVDNLKSNSLINNALLYIPVSYQNGNFYYPSVTLEVGYKTDSGKIVTFRTASYDNNQKAFVIDLRDYIQDIVSGKAENRGLYLNQSSLYFNCTAERIVFNGPASSYKTKPKLVIKYTEFK